MTALFVCGVARSGTSAIATALNADPRICIGMERYINLMLVLKCFSSDLLTEDRFFDFRESDTKLTPSAKPRFLAYYARLRKKWPKALYVGDKTPHLFRVLPELITTWPDARIIFMLRDPGDVANSWQRRASDPQDPWPASYDSKRAIKTWNEANTLVDQYLSDRRGPLLVVSYEEFFAGKGLERLCGFLNLSCSPELKSAYEKRVLLYRAELSSRHLNEGHPEAAPLPDQIKANLLL